MANAMASGKATTADDETRENVSKPVGAREQAGAMRLEQGNH